MKKFPKLVGLGVLALVACGILIWKMGNLPLQPAHVVIARVVAISPPASSGAGASRPGTAVSGWPDAIDVMIRERRYPMISPEQRPEWPRVSPS